jgi:hypothetical protein
MMITNALVAVTEVIVPVDMSVFSVRGLVKLDQTMRPAHRLFDVRVQCGRSLRNHGFLLSEEGWILSPTYDMSPDPHADGLKVNIPASDNAQE